MLPSQEINAELGNSNRIFGIFTKIHFEDTNVLLGVQYLGRGGLLYSTRK
jgi:hypothetical protein